MNRLFAAFASVAALSGTLPAVPTQAPGAGIDQQLRSLYRPSNVGSNGVVVQAGTMLLIQQDGIKASPATDQAPGQGYWPNSYKKGSRVKQPGLILARSDLQNVLDQARFLQVGEKAYLTAIDIKASDIVFNVQTSPDANGVPYRAAVTFKLEKGYLDSMNVQQIRDTIDGVFAIDTSTTAEPPPPPVLQPTQVSGLYFLQQTGAQLQLNLDGSFSLHAANGQLFPGHFTVNGDTLALTYSATGRSSVFRIQGDKIYADTGLAWVRVGDSPVPPPPPPPPPAPLKLPANYARAQAPADQLRLNADNTFSLQEGGQTYRGTFVANGNTLELNIIETNTKTTVTIQGNILTDSSGQTWALQEQSGPAAPSAGILQNQDVIKLVKAGFDDAVIIAKINSSKCQFDTSTDALIQLKQSGVSAAVLKAIVGTGK
jgi:hypothetical protein